MKQNMEPMVFGLCGEKPVREPLHYTACGLDNVYLCSGFIREEFDGEIYTSVKSMDHLYMMIAFSLSIKRRQLTGKELRFLRKYLDLTQNEMSDRLDVHRKTINAYECERKAISWNVQTILQIIALTDIIKTLKALARKRNNSFHELFKPEIQDIMEYMLHKKAEINRPEDNVMPPFIANAMIGKWKTQSGSSPT